LSCDILSGIHGIVRFDGGAVSQRDLERQSNALAHRGPDRRNFWHDGAVGMGHLLMRITAEDSFDAQPVHDRDAGLTLVADARLDNREELAGALAIDAAQLRELPDSALLLKAYRRWGTDCVEHLIGDFVFAVWDAPERKLVLGRDHMGQRHVFFHRGQDFFAFASEPKGLWALPDVPQETVRHRHGTANRFRSHAIRGEYAFRGDIRPARGHRHDHHGGRKRRDAPLLDPARGSRAS
jgi:asparagine synthase (glutamine-hydrolysing)